MTRTGSKRPFGYITDDGFPTWANLDESTYEVTALGFGQALLPSTIADSRLRINVTGGGTKMRYVNCVAITGAEAGVERRKFYVGTPDAPAWLDDDLRLVVDGTTYAITSRVGEVRSYPVLTDTAQLDGDIDIIEGGSGSGSGGAGA